jgi:two-component system LytT family response regulator
MIRALIIDDEALARSMLIEYLEDFKEVSVVGSFENGFDGLKAIQELKPDLIFLDIEMPKLNGFEMLELLDSLPKVIFITAYDQFAVQAFERDAVDYLLKPYTVERLKSAIDKASQMMGMPDASVPVRQLIQHQQESRESIDRIAVKTGTKIRIIYTEEMHYLESDDDYVIIHTDDGKYLKQQTMKYFEKHLPSKYFVRVHRSYIVRLDFVSQIELYERDSFIIKLKNGDTIPVSKSGYNRLRSTLNF